MAEAIPLRTLVHKILNEIQFLDKTEDFRNWRNKDEKNFTVCYHLQPGHTES